MVTQEELLAKDLVLMSSMSPPLLQSKRSQAHTFQSCIVAPHCMRASKHDKQNEQQTTGHSQVQRKEESSWLHSSNQYFDGNEHKIYLHKCASLSSVLCLQLLLL